MVFGSYKIFCLIGFLFVSIFGAISHFFYQWSGKKLVIGILFPANESTWEHLKLAIVPTFIYFFISSFFIENANFTLAFFMTLLIPIILIPLLFYSYSSILKKSFVIVDIIIYFISVAYAWGVCFKILNSNPVSNLTNIISLIGIFLIFIFYFSFTLYPPKNFLFKDPITGGYGL